MTMTFTYNIYSGKIAISNCDMSSLEKSMNSPIVKIVNPKYEIILEITNIPLNTTSVAYDLQYDKITFDALKVLYENGTYTVLKDNSTFKINQDGKYHNYKIFRENFGDPNLVPLGMEYSDHRTARINLSERANPTVLNLHINKLYYCIIKKTDMNLLNCNESKPCAIIIQQIR